ncbi:DUF805 domain-containing protein [Rhizobium oryzicola]|uniref:DUF805 domain-containing protein n=1 Tax=Rhizobium oryzicola TaxID=1232668 RepID=A0ABT8SX51_9HYPH|nr:DUF805 domain-containing protein [Rhizobium oryzicola]MDO1582926.1 DUF805 domain-containing protein [Rhizobium oryzicola]
MKKLLFTASGRINRATFWKGFLLVIGVTLVAGAAVFGYASAMAPAGTGDEPIQLEGAAAVPMVIGMFAIIAFNIVAGLCLAIKRLHDRNKSGWWMLIQFIPLIGSIWYFIEVGFLAGTKGENRFGADPLAL